MQELMTALACVTLMGVTGIAVILGICHLGLRMSARDRQEFDDMIVEIKQERRAAQRRIAERN